MRPFYSLLCVWHRGNKKRYRLKGRLENRVEVQVSVVIAYYLGVVIIIFYGVIFKFQLVYPVFSALRKYQQVEKLQRQWTFGMNFVFYDKKPSDDNRVTHFQLTILCYIIWSWYTFGVTITSSIWNALTMPAPFLHGNSIWLKRNLPEKVVELWTYAIYSSTFVNPVL